MGKGGDGQGSVAVSFAAEHLPGYKPEDRELWLESILSLHGESWFKPGALALFADCRSDAALWGRIATVAKGAGIFPPQLERAVDAYRHEHAENGDDAAAGKGRLVIVNAEALRRKTFPPEQWAIEGMLPVGCAVLAGKSKDGKSMMAYNVATAVATGGVAFGHIAVEQGAVLYLALEDGERRAKKRIDLQIEHIPEEVDLSLLELVLWEAPLIGDGLEEAIAEWIATQERPRLVIIDILEKVRPKAAKNGNVYADAYAATSSLTQLAHERNIAILVVHHVNKTKADDIRDAISGPVSLLGGADTFWTLKRAAGDADATLSIGGRDVAEQELALRFADGFWTILGDAQEHALSKTRKAIRTYLTDNSQPQTPKQIAVALDMPHAAMRQTLRRMAEDGHVLNIGNGRYVLNLAYQNQYEEEDDGANGGVTPVTGVTDVTRVTPVTLSQSDSSTLPGVTQNGVSRALISDAFGDLSDKVTGVTGGNARAHARECPECAACGGDMVIADAAGWYCLTCRIRVPQSEED